MTMHLNILVLAPVLTALVMLVLRDAKQVRMVAFLGSAVQLILALWLLFSYHADRKNGNTMQFLYQSVHEWFPSLGIGYHVGVDGISVAMILLTSLVVLAGVLFSWNVQSQPKQFFLLLVFLAAGAYGFFISLDLFTLFFFLEISVIPKYLLIAIWGSGRKVYSANKLALMLMGGSALILVGMLGLYFNCGHTFDMLKIAHTGVSMEMQRLLFPLIFVGFGVFSALFPFHTWVPDGHSSAPTAASMFLAGISMKLGGYGCIRAAVYLMPGVAHDYSQWIIILASIAILYGAFATMMQKDLKYMNAYSSVSHCGFVLLGIGMLTKTALTGAVMQMVSHGLMTALFFAAIGMIYERAHTRQISELGGLLKVIPFASVVIFIAGLCSLGLPGLSGFVAEMTVFMGSWENADAFHRIATIIGCASIVVTAVYILRALGAAVMGPIKNEHYLHLKDAEWNERLGSAILIIAILAIGFAPFWLSDLVSPDTGIIMSKIGGMAP